VTNESEIEAKATTGFCCYTGAHFSARSRGRGAKIITKKEEALAVVCVSISVVFGSSLAFFLMGQVLVHPQYSVFQFIELSFLIFVWSVFSGCFQNKEVSEVF
jgi:hypothetical protein